MLLLLTALLLLAVAPWVLGPRALLLLLAVSCTVTAATASADLGLLLVLLLWELASAAAFALPDVAVSTPAALLLVLPELFHSASAAVVTTSHPKHFSKSWPSGFSTGLGCWLLPACCCVLLVPASHALLLPPLLLLAALFAPGAAGCCKSCRSS